ncbi:MAG: fibrobacter succinogenes major paralogous domain-containing protein [Bacteroidetes bacterium]|nr:fibrobacter succinogenes major paralogous domain-containing protein [Bacteroidota bacterium]MDA0981212.1 fibrobacter succinogenes major paralogous domain-containing protein [Bacteroidota bacterium]
MRYLITFILVALSFNSFGQINPNFNPDYDGNNFIDISDLLGFLSSFGSSWDNVEVITGCTYSYAVEYNPLANVDDGSCTLYIDCACVINGSSLLDECGVCNGPGPSYTCWDGALVCGESDCTALPEFSPTVNIMLADLMGEGTSSLTYTMSQDSGESEIFSSSVISDLGSFNLSGLLVGDVIGSGMLYLELYAGNFYIISNLVVSNINNGYYTVFNYVTASSSPAYSVGDVAGGFVISNTESGINIYTEVPQDEDYIAEAYDMYLTFDDLFVNPEGGSLTFTSTLTTELGDVDVQEFMFDIIPIAPCGGLVSHDGYDYSVVQIGDQCWFAENCRYLPEASDFNTASETVPYYYVYGYAGTDVAAAKATENYSTYGVLYNWPAVMTEGICPSDWHIPSDDEWTQLTDFLGGVNLGGGKMKETGYDHWVSPNTGATNSSDFTGLPGGYRYTGGFFNKGYYGYWWSSTEAGSYSWLRLLSYYYNTVLQSDYSHATGVSARCVRD